MGLVLFSCRGAGMGSVFFIALSDRCEQRAAMARKILVEFEGATYHVMCRGNGREKIMTAFIELELALSIVASVVNSIVFQ